MRSIRPSARQAFTLIELLVVIAIIAILAAILVAGILPLIKKGPDLQDMDDIKQLEIGVNNFKAKFGCFPPSKIRLRANVLEYIAKANGGKNPKPDALDDESLSYISQIWPLLSSPTSTFTTGAYTWDAGMSLNPPTGKPWVTGQSVVLDGDQCLVFFLGGPIGSVGGNSMENANPSIPAWSVGGPLGFSPDPQDPCGKILPGQSRISFFKFKPERLIDPVRLTDPGQFLTTRILLDQNSSLRSPAPWPLFAPAPVPTPWGFPSYLNNWGNSARPYAYFSSGRNKNGYNSGGAISHEIVPLDYVAPYFDSFTLDQGNYKVSSYLNPSGFQIISAGADGVFTNPPASYPNQVALPYPYLSMFSTSQMVYLNPLRPRPYAPSPLYSPGQLPPNNIRVPPLRCSWNRAVAGLSGEPSVPDGNGIMQDFWKDNRANFTPDQLQVP